MGQMRGLGGREYLEELEPGQAVGAASRKASK